MNRGCLILFFIPFVLVGVFSIGNTVYEYQRYVELRDTGQETRGRFVDKRFTTSTDDDGNTSYSYYVTFTFTLREGNSEQVYNIEESVAEGVYNSADNGEPLKVTYAEEDPTNATIEPVGLGDTIAIAIFSLCWNGILLFIGGIFFFISRGSGASTSVPSSDGMEFMGDNTDSDSGGE